MRLSKILIVAAATFAVPVQTAFAQDPAEGTEGEVPAEGEAPVEGEGAMTGEATTEPVVDASGAVAGTWSQRFIDRPVNLLKGMIRVDGDLFIGRINFPAIPPLTTGGSATVVGLTAGAGYGVSDKLEIGGSYGITLKDFEAKGPLRVYGLFNFKNEQKLRISAGASLTYNLAAESLGIAAGLAFQYHLNEKMMIFMPPSHLQVGLDPTNIAINIPVGFGFQANDNIFASAQTNIGTIGIDPSGTSFIFADVTPLTLSAFYSPSNKMDLGVSFGMPNVPDVADIFTVTLSARLFMGDVPASGSAMMAPAGDMTPPPM